LADGRQNREAEAKIIHAAAVDFPIVATSELSEQEPLNLQKLRILPALGN